LGAMVIMNEVGMSRSFLVLFSGCFGLFLLVGNSFLPRQIARWFYAHQVKNTPVLLIGNAADVEYFQGRVQRGDFLGIEAVGFLSLPNSESEGVEAALPCFGSVDDMEEICETRDLGAVVLINGQGFEDLALDLSLFCEKHCLRFAILDDLSRRFGRNFASSSQGGSNLYVRAAEPLQDPSNTILKRLFDLVLASLVILFVLPWTALLVWLMQQMSAPGPLFERELRVGEGEDSSGESPTGRPGGGAVEIEWSLTLTGVISCAGLESPASRSFSMCSGAR
ncbi:MAG: hypothetical protein AAGJ31_00530, partial [Verrucomicrobiota bacterium]